MEKSFKLGFPASNNEVEYKALLTGLKMSKRVGVDRVQLCCDSRLVVSQITGKFKAKDQRMICYLKEVGKPKCQFKNSHVDSLGTLASSMADLLPRIVLVKLLPLFSLTLSDKNFILSIHPSTSWMDPIVAYLRSGIQPKDKKESEQIRCRSLQYWVS